MESCLLKYVVGLAENGVELAHPTGPVLGHVALHEQAVTVTYAVSEVVNDCICEIPAIEIIGVLEMAKACVLQQAIDEFSGEE